MSNVKQPADSRVTGEPTVLEDSHVTSEPKGGKVKPLEDSHVTSEPKGGKCGWATATWMCTSCGP
ncbi:hypothetical protein ACWC9S_10090, partial [Streptomyces xiamenensis]